MTEHKPLPLTEDEIDNARVWHNDCIKPCTMCRLLATLDAALAAREAAEVLVTAYKHAAAMASDRAAILAAECESLRAVVERLPKTADGVSVLEGDPVWGLEESPPEPFQASVMHWQRRKDGTWAFWAGYSHAARPIHSDNKRWYSTRAAAEAARLAGKGGSDAR